MTAQQQARQPSSLVALCQSLGIERENAFAPLVGTWTPLAGWVKRRLDQWQEEQSS